ncbi:hypothetical protein K501DRAFT_272595 [Backusella circina FSU 941]|nr:hypothetical protein K501DRAFT_272595 [Backusella circina FSU 941]
MIPAKTFEKLYDLPITIDCIPKENRGDILHSLEYVQHSLQCVFHSLQDILHSLHSLQVKIDAGSGVNTTIETGAGLTGREWHVAANKACERMTRTNNNKKQQKTTMKSKAFSILKTETSKT